MALIVVVIIIFVNCLSFGSVLTRLTTTTTVPPPSIPEMFKIIKGEIEIYGSQIFVIFVMIILQFLLILMFWILITGQIIRRYVRPGYIRVDEETPLNPSY